MQITKLENTELLFGSGGIGAGKTEIARLISTYLSLSNQVVAIDSSRCIANSVRLKTNVGRKLAPYMEAQTNGLLMPPELAFYSIMENVYWLVEKMNPRRIIIPGAYRAPDEGALWKDVRGLVPWKMFFIPTTDKEIAFGVFLRQRKGGGRIDDANSSTVRKRIDEYEQKTIPAVESIPPQLVKVLPRSLSLTDRILGVVEHLNMGTRTREAWTREVYNKHRPIRRAINELDAEEKVLRKEFEALNAPAADLPLSEKHFGHGHQTSHHLQTAIA